MKKTIMTTVVVGLFFAVSTSMAYAYDASTTHAMLTKSAVSVYNGDFSNKLSSSTLDLLIEGSIKEDDNPRYFRHFYDPINNNGLLGFDSAKTWSTADGKNVYNWNIALYKYNTNDKQHAYRALGQVLHLIEDMSVPEHTRIDTHPQDVFGIYKDASPYELYTSRFTATNTSITADGPAIDLPTLEDYFDQLATYSNNNFYSKDTIEKAGYPIIATTSRSEILSDGKLHTFAIAPDGMRLYEIATSSCAKKGVCTFKKNIDDIDHLVMQGYWDKLSKQAVRYSAGVINLFFKEAEKAKAEIAKQEESKSWFLRLTERIKLNIQAALKLVNQYLAQAIRDGNASAQARWTRLQADLKSLNQEVASTTRAVNATSTAIEKGKLSFWDYLTLGTNEGRKLIASVTEVANNAPEISKILINFNLDQATSSPEAPVILLPTTITLSKTFATSTITFSGAAEPFTSIYSDFAPDISTTTSATGTWKLILTDLPNGTTTINFFAANEFGTSSPTSVTIFVKTKKIEPPQPAMAIMMINEIAWHGTSSTTPEDKFIELRLYSDKSISLNDYALIVGSTTIPLSGQLPADTDVYYVIERGDDNVVSDQPADLVANFDLDPTSLDLRLVKIEADGSTTTLDQVNFSTTGFCNNYDDCPYSYYDSLERFTYGNPNSNSAGEWSDWTAGRKPNGLNRNGLPIIGTPGRINQNRPILN